MTPDPGPIFTIRGATKSFGASRALDGVSLDLFAGEVHALVGENGAGKSTLMKVLSGAVRPDAGEMTLDGTRYAPRGPREARDRGVAMIYQELALAPHLSVEANVLLGLEKTRLGLIRKREHRRIVAEAMEFLDHPEIRPDTPVSRLGTGPRQLVEVARALVSGAKLIVFDEPTSSLTAADAARLFAAIERLKDRGLAIVYISHFLEELKQVARRYTVLRDGRTVATGPIAGTSQATIAGQMVGRDLSEIYPRSGRTPGEILLTLAGASGRDRPRGVDLEVRRGEILGIAGLIGAGRTELLRMVYGLDPVRAGSVSVAGIACRSSTPAKRIGQGVGFLSEDRKEEGLALGRSIEDNLTYSALPFHAWHGWLNLRGRRAAARRWIEALRVRSAGPGQAVGKLSGGNQQKVALARLLHQKADLLLLDEPTRGVDLGAKAEIYRRIGDLAAEGKAIVVVSSYLPELLGLCDRIAVMARGRLGPARPVGEWTEQAIMEQATGA